MRTRLIDKSAVGLMEVVQGWVHRTRDHGGLTFVDVRDYDGLIQCVFDSYKGPVDFHHLRDESVVRVSGEIRLRPEGTENPDLYTGDVEMEVVEIEILNEASVLPFKVFTDADEEYTASLEQRLKYRYLDLRRSENRAMLNLRSYLMFTVRSFMHQKGFTEVQTPILTASSPEGARDYLVPARLHPGKFYALPQAPQIFKQLLMASGVEKYFQIAPCFRDEAGRSDRAPGEFYQIDMEIAFATQDTVFDVVSELLETVFVMYGKHVTPPRNEWPQIPYAESMMKYGTDKPDLRAKLEMIDLTDLFREEGPPFIVDAVKKGHVVKGLCVYHAENLTGKFYKDMEKYAQELGMPGLGYIKTGFDVTSGKTTGGPLAKFMSEKQIEKLESITGTNTLSSSTLQATFVMVGHEKAVNAWGSDLRVELSKRVDDFDDERYEFCFIVDYPMFELDENNKIEFSHNPFSMPQGGMEALEGDPLDVLAYQYDVVCNGVELSSGAIRNHKPELMLKAFEIAGYDEEVVKNKFPSLWQAFHYGCPPHGGIAPGFDRILMLLMGKDNIRDVIAFPMNGQAEDLMMGAPSEVTDEQLKELNIRSIAPKK